MLSVGHAVAVPPASSLSSSSVELQQCEKSDVRLSSPASDMVSHRKLGLWLLGSSDSSAPRRAHDLVVTLHSPANVTRRRSPSCRARARAPKNPRARRRPRMLQSAGHRGAVKEAGADPHLARRFLLGVLGVLTTWHQSSRLVPSRPDGQRAPLRRRPRRCSWPRLSAVRGPRRRGPPSSASSTGNVWSRPAPA